MSDSADSEARVACVELPALPLQLLLREHPRWRELPVAVLEADRPQAKLLWVNEQARALRVLPGMRFAAARSLATSLRAAVVTELQIETATAELFGALLEFSPRVEPAGVGTLYVDPSGMVLLWGRLESWALAIHQRLAALGFDNTVVVGFHRFRAHAIARTHTGAWVLDDRHREARMAASVALDRLELPPRLRDELAGLGVRTLGQFLALPGAEMRLRFGGEAERLHRQASEGRWEPLRARALVEPIRETLALEPSESDLARLLFAIKPLLDRLLVALADRGTAMSALHLRLQFERVIWPNPPPPPHEQRIEPAAPTLDGPQILELVRLRLDAIELPSPIESLTLELEGQRVDARQIALFRAQARRDLDAADRALARLRASFGAESVTRATLRAAHLPEARFGWTPVAHVGFPSPDRMHVEGELPPRIRRLRHRPLAINLLQETFGEGVAEGVEGLTEGSDERANAKRTGAQRLRGGGPGTAPPARGRAAERPPSKPIASNQSALTLHGPFRASGAWWVREIERDYYYAETRGGEVLWVFFDRPRRRWYLHGRVD
ncbi:DNA polymerase Y family protein [Nannocystaceae bacterium ST9]